MHSNEVLFGIGLSANNHVSGAGLMQIDLTWGWGLVQS